MTSKDFRSGVAIRESAMKWLTSFARPGVNRTIAYAHGSLLTFPLICAKLGPFPYVEYTTFIVIEPNKAQFDHLLANKPLNLNPDLCYNMDVMKWVDEVEELLGDKSEFLDGCFISAGFDDLAFAVLSMWRVLKMGGTMVVVVPAASSGHDYAKQDAETQEVVDLLVEFYHDHENETYAIPEAFYDAEKHGGQPEVWVFTKQPSNTETYGAPTTEKLVQEVRNVR